MSPEAEHSGRWNWSKSVLSIQLFLSIPFCSQVHGVTNDTIKFVQNIINTEINSATDNPVSFPGIKTTKLDGCHFFLCTRNFKLVQPERLYLFFLTAL